MPRKILIDTDPGVDDLLAILVALPHPLDEGTGGLDPRRPAIAGCLPRERMGRSCEVSGNRLGDSYEISVDTASDN